MNSSSRERAAEEALSSLDHIPKLNRVAVVGAGFSGSLTTVHLARKLPCNYRIILCEASSVYGPGLAYSTQDENHLVNLPAQNMSAFPDEPDHFVEWLQSRANLPSLQKDSLKRQFVQRKLYGQYISDILLTFSDKIVRIPQEVVDIEQILDVYRLHLLNLVQLDAGHIVLATGYRTGSRSGLGRALASPWEAPNFASKLGGMSKIAILGTGLTAIDLTTSLYSLGFIGKTIAISRRGLLPRPFRYRDFKETIEMGDLRGNSLSWLLNLVRGEVVKIKAQGKDWRDVFNAMQTQWNSIWVSLSLAERKRFLRHLRPWFDIHRHQMPIPTFDFINNLIADGKFTVLAGRSVKIDRVGDRYSVEWRRRGVRRSETGVFDLIFDATGEKTTLDARLIQNLSRRGLAKIDDIDMGLKVSDTLSLISSMESAQENLSALGPIVRGTFWDSTGVPAIRLQAQTLATKIVEQMRIR